MSLQLRNTGKDRLKLRFRNTSVTMVLLATWCAVPNMVLGTIAGFCLLIALFGIPRARVIPGILGLVILGFIVGTLLAGLAGALPPLTLLLPLAVALSALVIASLYGDRLQRADANRAASLAVLVYAFGTFANATRIYESDSDYTYLDTRGGIAGDRWGAFGLDPNISVGIVLLALAIAAITASPRSLTPPLDRYIYRGAILVTPLVVLASTSRMAALLTVPVYAYILFKWIRAYYLVPLAISVIGIALLLGPTLAATIPAFSKLAGTDVGELRSDNLRIFLWERGAALVPENLPFGVGWGRSAEMNTTVIGFPITFHSSWIMIPLELGVVGAVCIFVALGVSAIVLLRTYKFYALLPIGVFIAINSITPFVGAVGPFLSLVILAWIETRGRDHLHHGSTLIKARI